MNLIRRFLSFLFAFALTLGTFALAACDSGAKTPEPESSEPSNPEGEPPVDLLLQTEAKDPAELDARFYDASSWEYMTNNNGASRENGGVPVSLDDGSIKFHFARQAIEIGEHTNKTLSFMLKGTNDWEIWLNSTGIDNQTSSAYLLKCVDGEIIFTLSSCPNVAAVSVAEGFYNKAEWNRFDIAFREVDGYICIEIYINGKLATLNAGTHLPEELSASGDAIVHDYQSTAFEVGNYIAVKVFSADNYLQIKPVAKANEKDVPIIACVGDSITQGAGSSNEYFKSYPVQLQKELGGKYNVVNLGRNGTTAAQRNGSEGWLANVHWDGFQALVPDIVILALGTNDSKYSPSEYKFYSDYDNVVSQLLSVNPDMKIIVSTAPTSHSDAYNIKDENIKSVIAPVQRDIAWQYGFDIIDMCVFTADLSHLFPDGIHPNDAGYTFFAKVYAKAITEGVEALTDEFISGLK